MNKIEIYCVTNKKLNFLEKTPLKLVGVGQKSFQINISDVIQKIIFIIRKNIIRN